VKRKQILTVNGIRADNRYHIIVHISIDLTFDSFKYDRATRFLKLENCGDVAIDLSFEKIEAQSTATTTTSFFFDKFPFRIIPHEVLEMPFHFYPTETGLFCEKWKLNCDPHFTYDHQIVINLIGICKSKHKIEDEVAKLEAEITRKAAQFSVRQEIKNIIDLSIPKCREDRLSSEAIDPIEMKFNAMNPKLTYCPSIVELMSQLHHRINASDQWNYDVDALYGHIMNIHDNDELQKELYRQFNDAYGKLLTTGQKQSKCDDKIVKIAMIKCLFGQFFDRFETEMEAAVDNQLNSIAKIFATTINKMISILES
jgi:MYCBP-associated protein family